MDDTAGAAAELPKQEVLQQLFPCARRSGFAKGAAELLQKVKIYYTPHKLGWESSSGYGMIIFIITRCSSGVTGHLYMGEKESLPEQAGGKHEHTKCKL